MPKMKKNILAVILFSTVISFTAPFCVLKLILSFDP